MAAMGAAGAEGGAVSEGDPCDLAIARSETFPNRRVVMISTPTVQGISRIEQAYSESDQRKYNVPCPHCGAFQVLRWAQVKWPEGEPDKAVYECISCRKAIEDHHKPGILQRGQWRAEVVGDGHTAGFWLNGLYSPWNTWARLAKTFLRASKSPERLRVFVNTVLAETWEDPSTEKLEISELMPRREPITEPLPAGIALLTAGIDVQQDRLEAAVYGWGADEECWLIGYYVIRGDTTRPEVWNDLDKLLTRNWKHEFGISLHVNATCIDSGYASGTVYGFCRPRYNRKVYAIKGRAGRYPVWPRKVSHGKDRSLMFLVGVDPCKDWIAPHLRIAQPGPGYMHFPLTVDQTFFEQLGSERVRIRYTHGYAVREWFKAPGARNEALDATCYAYAALQSLVVGGMKLNSYAEKVEAMRKAEGTPTPDKSAQSEGKRDPWYYDHRASGCSNWLGNRGRGWLDRHR
jgi:phage terminase large subunit GpA-like protein